MLCVYIYIYTYIYIYIYIYTYIHTTHITLLFATVSTVSVVSFIMDWGSSKMKLSSRCNASRRLCMYVCMHVCMYVCVCMPQVIVQMYVCMGVHACMHACNYFVNAYAIILQSAVTTNNTGMHIMYVNAYYVCECILCM